ncbi:hypothetical protein [Micromonospora sp. B9E7]|uniref:hypothetical protein n=1 Tax=Micromonospora sp. B9E7 TaxID=3153574 RepID=UPI00325E5076
MRQYLSAVLRRYPVTAVILAPYAVLIVPMAVANDNPETGFILRVLAMALAGTVTLETVALLVMRPSPGWQQALRRANSRFPRIYLLARLAAAVSIAADLTGAIAGRGTIESQVASQGPSSLANLTSLVVGWKFLAFALLLASFLGGRTGRRGVYAWTLALVGAQLAVASFTAILAPMLGYLFFVASVGAICGVFRARLLLVAAAVLFLAWPTMFALRNDLRADRGIAVSQDSSATGRLRVDAQLAQVATIDVPVNLRQPGLTDYVWYGLVPRLVDPDRPPITTGSDINQYLGGGASSSYNFLALGNIYFFSGPVGVVAFHACWALLAVILLRWRRAPGPARLSVLSFAMGGPLLWSSTYPDAMIAFVQYMVSALPVLAVVLATRTRSGGRDTLSGRTFDHGGVPAWPVR